MKYKLLSIAIGLCLIETAPVYAITSSAREAKLEKDIQQVTAQTTTLQKEVRALKAELKTVRSQNKTIAAEQHSVQTAATSTKSAGKSNYTLGSAVTLSPYIRLHPAYDGSDLIVNYSTMNEDLRLLQQRAVLEQNMTDADIAATSHPNLQLSGGIEAQGIYAEPYHGKHASDIDLTRAELDAFSEIGPWAQGFLSYAYDNMPLDSEIDGSGNRVANSRVFLERGFITIGNQNKTPFYASIGQMYVPFGIYSNNVLTSTPTKLLGRTNARTILLGFSNVKNNNGFYASTYAFNGPSNYGNTGIDDYGVNGGYKFSGPSFTAEVGAGAINNLADSIIMQNTYSSTGFEGFGESPATELLVHRVPAYDAHAQVGMGPFVVYGEYIASTRAFDSRDLMFNYAGAKPRAGYAEADYTFNVLNKPAAFALAYGETWQSLALGLPKNSYITSFSISLWKNTIESIEFRHDINYAHNDAASGRCDQADTALCMTPASQWGHSQNTITAQIGAYF